MADKKQSFQEQHGGFADAVEDFLMGGLDLVVPHARREPLNPMAYVKDVNEWFMPAGQMALDEASGDESYPAWAYALASLPVVGKVGKVAGKVAAKTAGNVGKTPLPRRGFLKEIKGEKLAEANKRIKDLEESNRSYEKYKKTKQVYDKNDNPIGNGTSHASYKVFDIPGAEFSVEPSLSTESVYVTYKMPNGKTSKVRYSNHFSNNEYKDEMDILYELGLLDAEQKYVKKLGGQNVKKSEIPNYKSSGKTYKELLALPEEELAKYKDMLILNDNGELVNWKLYGDTWNQPYGVDYFLKDEFAPLFEDY